MAPPNEDNAELELDQLAAEEATVAGSPYTKTYNTAARTIPAATAAGVTPGSTQNATTAASDLTTSEALANALKANYNAAQTDLANLATDHGALIADVLALRKLVVALVTDLEAAKIVG